MQVGRAHLSPLPEAVVASMTLHELPLVDADIPVGWAPAALTIAIGHLASRPGTTVTLWKSDGTLKATFAGGTYLDASTEVYPHPGIWYGSEIAYKSCEPCGRPGWRHTFTSPIECDSCFVLNSGRTPDFDPRLPLDVDAAEALRRLPQIKSLPVVPAGWAPLVRSVLKRLGDGRGGDVVFDDRATYLTIVSAPDPQQRVAEVRQTLVALSRERCRYCGRHVDEGSGTPGECDGCLWVRARGWTVSPAAETNSPGSGDGRLS